MSIVQLLVLLLPLLQSCNPIRAPTVREGAHLTPTIPGLRTRSWHHSARQQHTAWLPRCFSAITATMQPNQSPDREGGVVNPTPTIPEIRTRSWHHPARQQHTAWLPRRALVSTAIVCCHGVPIASGPVHPAASD